MPSWGLYSQWSRMIKLYYWKPRINFGDLLSPLIIERVLNKRVTYAPLHRADLLALGSLMQVLMPDKRPLSQWYRSWFNHAGLHLMPSREKLHIWGTGALHPELSLAPFRKLEIHALRGEKSQKLFSLVPTAIITLLEFSFFMFG